ncbi:MAG TPA: alkaline phosphatase D family protein [Pseudolabrys sp.]|jgi:alkaline phosphatase D
MSRVLRAGRAPTRRRFLTTIASAAAGTALGGLAAPAFSRLAERPVITHGVQSGDVSAESGIVWARADRPARMLIETATTESFKDIRNAAYVDALPESDFTAKALIEDLPAGQDIFYRLRFQDLSSPNVIGEPVVGRFRTAPRDTRPVSFVWSGDTAGQGWGIDSSRGGMRTYATMLNNRPDFFVHCGDNIYADCAIPAKLKLPNGGTWRNIVTEEKSKAAETLAEYRGNYKYNLLDQNLRAFNAEVPMFAQWDNHEVMEEWWPGEPLNRRGYVEKNAMLLAARGCRAFHEFMPLRYTPAEPGRIYRKISYGPLLDVFLLDMRSYRGPNDGRPADHYGPDVYLLGPAQLAWLKRELARSKATWKVIASDTPLGTIVAGAPGARRPLGRGIEIADLLSFMQQASIRNTLWITADLHYTAAHYFDPNQAVFQDFEPFWEFVSGPIHAGTWTPSKLDTTFGLHVVYQSAASREQGENLAPCFGLQFFGRVAIDGTTGVLTATLKDIHDRALWSKQIEPKSDRNARSTRPSLPG